MGKIINGYNVFAGSPGAAKYVKYDNSQTGIDVSDVQGALDYIFINGVASGGGIDLLWKNSDTTAELNGDIVSIDDLSKYDSIKILGHSTGSTQVVSFCEEISLYEFIESDEQERRVSCFENGGNNQNQIIVFFRTFGVKKENNTVTAYNGYTFLNESGPTINNTIFVPWYILGIKKSSSGGGVNTAIIPISQAEYDALPDTKYSDNKVYFIYDAGSNGKASAVDYDNTTSGLKATDTQAAIDEIINKLRTETVPIDTGLYIERSGNVCVLHLSGYTGAMTALIPDGYIPKSGATGMVRYSDGSGYYPALLTITSGGNMGGTFLKNDTTNPFLSTGILYGTITWCIS